MPINSKEKGKRFERLMAALFRENGYPAFRTAQYRGNTGQAGDVEGLPFIHCEMKHQERIQIYDWMEQAERDAKASGNGHLPAVFFKKNASDILVAMKLDDWFTLYREWEASESMKIGL